MTGTDPKPIEDRANGHEHYIVDLTVLHADNTSSAARWFVSAEGYQQLRSQLPEPQREVFLAGGTEALAFGEGA